MSFLEPGSDREGGNLGHRAQISTAISTKRAADTLERIEALLTEKPVDEAPPATDAGEMRERVEGASPELVEIIRQWLMSTDHPVSDWETQFAVAIQAMLRSAGWKAP